jgi:hypothetical protein
MSQNSQHPADNRIPHAESRAALRTIRNGDRAWSSRCAGASQEDAETRDEYGSAESRRCVLKSSGY